ncbi:GH1 family beta-glucosidase [Undibacterium sp. TS12]|uniref:GH1 family beta-glucosidase n=1 Tax=Undibacterium sp. TS12 TaxID=2908202 RepID=UPI001F4CE0BF|nr:GH1 family beta-glucosidase [Undibacterium sp. TS12]MCH8617952.1 GH1 family beta-glucosidase [Undibacterium sp. TS12]
MTTSLQHALPSVARSDFNNDFLWGTATSAYQIEGAASLDGRVESIWDRFCSMPGVIRDGSNGAVSCDHYHHWPEDLDIASSLGSNAYRFSISWPRIFSGPDAEPNAEGLAFYSRLVDGMLARGLQPWATLYHWDLPQYLQDQGGWNSRDTVHAFVRFADVVSRHLGDRVKHWITHNEPWCTAMLGHADGIHAPGIKDFKMAIQVCHHVLLSHGLATPVIRANVPDSRIGLALNLHPISAATDKAEDQTAADLYDGLRNRWYLDPLYGRGYPTDVWNALADLAPAVKAGDMAAIAVSTDFLGVNFYFPERIEHAPGVSALNLRLVDAGDVERTAFGWEVAPAGMTTLLKRIQDDYAPAAIYITENGATYDDVLDAQGEIQDVQRRDYLIRHLAAIKEAIRLGCQVRGYFLWSLLDNFEWAEGCSRRFGIIHVDFVTQRRTLKLSGKWYRDFLAGRVLPAAPDVNTAGAAGVVKGEYLSA